MAFQDDAFQNDTVFTIEGFQTEETPLSGGNDAPSQKVVGRSIGVGIGKGIFI